MKLLGGKELRKLERALEAKASFRVPIETEPLRLKRTLL